MMLKERIAAAMAYAELTPTMLVARTGATKGAVSQWLNGTTKNLKSESALAISKATRVNHEWLISGTGEMASTKAQPVSLISRSKSNADNLAIPQYQAGGAMGQGLILEEKQPGIIKSWVVDQEWLRLNVRVHTGAANLCIVTGFGTSMQPKYNPGDPLLLDQGVTNVESDGIYFFRVGKHGFIKQLQRIPTESGMVIRAKSLNKDYDPFDISEKMDFQVFGKVLTVWKGEQIG